MVKEIKVEAKINVKRTRLLAYYEEDAMASIGEEKTNVHCFLCARPQPDKSHKQPSIKVRLKDGRFKQKNGTAVVSIEDNPKKIDGNLIIPSDIFLSIEKWIRLNKTPLLRYWNDPSMLTSELFDLLKPI